MNQTAAFSEVEMSIVVPKDSDIKDVNQLTTVQAPTKVDKNNVDTLMSALKKDKRLMLKLMMLLHIKKHMTILSLANLKLWS